MNYSAVLKSLDAERRTLQRDGEILEIGPAITRVASPDGSRNEISFSRLTADDADAAIAREVIHYRAVNKELEWKVYAHDTPADLPCRLAHHGFNIGPCEAVVALDLHEAHAWIDAPSSVKVLRVSNLEQLAMYRAAAEQIFTKDYQSTTEDLARHIKSGTTGHLGYLAIDGLDAVSIGRLYTHQGSIFGGLYGGATLATHRGRGFYRAVVAVRARDARELGARYLLADALPTSRPILERLGFVRITETWPCTLTPTMKV